MKGLGTRPVRVSVDDGSGEWIDIKPVFSRGDVDWIRERMFEYVDQTIKLHINDRATLLLKRAIVDWHLVGEDGQEFPFAEENIDSLPNEVDGEPVPLIDKVYQEIVERNPTLATIAL